MCIFQVSLPVVPECTGVFEVTLPVVLGCTGVCV